MAMMFNLITLQLLIPFYSPPIKRARSPA